MVTTQPSHRTTDPVPTESTRGESERLLISEILETLTQARPLRETLETITAIVCGRLGISSCAILLEHAGDDLLMIEGAAGLSASYVEAINHNFPVHIEELGLSESPSSQAFRTGHVVMVQDTEADADFLRWRKLAAQQGYRSLISVPLHWQGHIVGTLNGYHREPRRFHDDEIQTLSIAATQIGVAIQIARLVDAQQQTIRRLEELAHQLNEQRHLLERSAEIHATLTQLVLNNQGIPAIAAALARVVQAPVVVQDQFYQVLAGANETGEAITGCVALTREALALRSARPHETDARAPFELAATPKHALTSPRAVAPIIAGHNMLGYVSLQVAELPVPPLHLRALGQAATVLALEMVKERLAHEIELRVRRGFADDLVAGRYDDVEQMRERARYLGYDLTGPFQVLVFDIDGFGRYVAENRLSEADIDALRRHFADALVLLARHRSPRLMVAGRHDRLTLIVPHADTPKLLESIIAAARYRLEQALPSLTVSIGIGRVHAKLDDVRASYQEADQVLHVVRRLGGNAKTVLYEELGVSRLLLQAANPAELIDFARARLHPLLEYDAQHGGILMAALDGYVRANRSVGQAAEALNLHPNTLRYRLRKVEEMLDSPLTNITLLLEIQLACLVLQLIDEPARPSVLTAAHVQ